ncbi:family 4 glycosyl hydrolase, alpha-galactosidase/6-phospho-beta-glucosidase (plasmid) [Thermus oshimai JL-2]|uniref:Family 4 glycosyl hydrolase, alpha-galactosidase/6-phospho-beta-glucosidase n=1 Tax=Thermus oshimai JL-2 TaxID=751945 RepID=K7RM03_THEOS|nr:family 4 glycosyl hydrolase alpha-galactosidase/6-phospho-beta-glucosidase [Thermus oshimai]AFV77412.1 family 4 glycosyl hydrolase, alpha-galactosidase/6-phospho-beta-glucosidase [Thermus oshimai JL-2]
MIRIAFVGAGNAVFGRTFLLDLFLSPLEEVEVRLVDPEGDRLARLVRLGEKFREEGPKAVYLRPLPLPEALRGAHVLVFAADVGGEEVLRQDYETALAFGVDQSIGDTLGPGGLMKFLRLLPLLEEVAEGFQGELILNYANPLTAVTAFLARKGHRALGLCHSIAETARTLAGYLGFSEGELDYLAGGVNHLSWFVRLAHGGEDLYPRLRALAQQEDYWELDPVRFELLRVFGLFPSESSGHVSEYLPYFRKRPEIMARYVRSGYRGESGFYPRHHLRFVEEALREEEAWLRGAYPKSPSGEYAVPVLEAFFLGRAFRLYATHLETRVPGLLAGFPAEAPLRLPAWKGEEVLLPPGPLALSRHAQEVQALWVEGALGHDPSLLLQGLALDPLTAAVLDLRGIEALFRRLVEAGKGLLPSWVT